MGIHGCHTGGYHTKPWGLVWGVADRLQKKKQHVVNCHSPSYLIPKNVNSFRILMIQPKNGAPKLPPNSQKPKSNRIGSSDLLGAVPLGDVLGHIFKLVVGGPPRSLPADFCEVLFFNHSEGATSILRGCKDACLRFSYAVLSFILTYCLCSVKSFMFLTFFARNVFHM